MTTITIKSDEKLSRTQFESVDELLAHFMGKRGFGVLLPLDKKDLTTERKMRFKKALNKPKSQMLNI